MRRLIASAAVLLTLAVAGLPLLLWWRPAPQLAGRLDDLDADAAGLLRGPPGVVAVTRDGPAGRPSCRIVHVRDWHLIPPDLHALDAGRQGERYAEHLDTVEACQAGQARVLAALVEGQGPRVLPAEGLTPSGLKAWAARVEALPDAAAQQADLRRMVDEAEALGEKELAREVRELIEQHRRDRLELGAAGWLAAEYGVKVLPLDDPDTLDGADPRRTGGRLDPARRRARQAAMVRRAVEAGPVAVLLLGGADDVSNCIPSPATRAALADAAPRRPQQVRQRRGLAGHRQAEERRLAHPLKPQPPGLDGD
jgi:hypothetical protein